MGAELDRNAFAFTAILYPEHAEVQVRAARKAGVAGPPDAVARVHPLAQFHARTLLLQMAVMTQRAVFVPNRDVIIEFVEAHAGAAGIRILLHAYDYARARRADQRAFGHLPVQRILVRALVAELSVIALRNGEPVARLVRQLIFASVVVAGAVAAEFVIVGVRVLPSAVF